jgi:hypothetical protein
MEAMFPFRPKKTLGAVDSRVGNIPHPPLPGTFAL